MRKLKARCRVCAFFGLIATVAAVSTTQSHAAMNASPAISSDGVVSLSWERAGDETVTVQQSGSADFSAARTIYTGSDTASTITGLSDGTYYFRLGSGPTPVAWQEPVTVTVEHHPLSRALGFFGLGLFVFAATLWLVIGGARRQREP